MRYCVYCSKMKPQFGFKQILHPASNSRRGMCEPCQQIRLKPRSELEALAQQTREERKKKK